eukprot:2466980-Prymnesium_polylepis.1
MSRKRTADALRCILFSMSLPSFASPHPSSSISPSGPAPPDARRFLELIGSVRPLGQIGSPRFTPGSLLELPTRDRRALDPPRFEELLGSMKCCIRICVGVIHTLTSVPKLTWTNKWHSSIRVPSEPLSLITRYPLRSRPSTMVSYALSTWPSRTPTRRKVPCGSAATQWSVSCSIAFMPQSLNLALTRCLCLPLCRGNAMGTSSETAVKPVTREKGFRAERMSKLRIQRQAIKHPIPAWISEKSAIQCNTRLQSHEPTRTDSERSAQGRRADKTCLTARVHTCGIGRATHRSAVDALGADNTNTHKH